MILAKVSGRPSFVGAGHPGIGAEHVQAEARSRLQDPVARILLEEQRADAAGGIERVLVEVRQEVGRLSAVRQEGTERPLGRASAAGGRTGVWTRQSSGSRISRHRVFGGVERFYCECIDAR